METKFIWFKSYERKKKERKKIVSKFSTAVYVSMLTLHVDGFINQ